MVRFLRSGTTLVQDRVALPVWWYSPGAGSCRVHGGTTLVQECAALLCNRIRFPASLPYPTKPLVRYNGLVNKVLCKQPFYREDGIMIDSKAFRSMSYGVYVISAIADGKAAGCVVNTLVQVTSKPARVSVAINKENFTAGIVQKAGRFEAVVLAESAPMELIGTFGFRTSAEFDKFAACEHAFDEAGVPFPTEYAVAHVGARVIEMIDAGSHMLFVGEVEEAAVLSGEPPMTYAYYHKVKGGKTPPKASSYEDPEAVAAVPEPAPAPVVAAPEPATAAAPAPAPESAPAPAPEPAAAAASAPASEPADPTKRYAWRCTICDNVIKQDEIADDFRCPVCGLGKNRFERIER